MKEYLIPFKGLKDGEHNFEFHIDNKFFAHFEASEIQQGEIDVNVKLKIKHDFLELQFIIQGKVNVQCDRCLGYFDILIFNTEQLFVEFGDVSSDITDVDNILTLSYGENDIDLKQHIYEYIALSIPYQRIHPDDKDGNSTCDPDMLEYLEMVNEDEVSESESEIDPRWATLKDLNVN